MINSVRNTVLSVLNKNNYGYLSPSDFNLFAKQAQLELFEDNFFNYNNTINKENARISGTGYADNKKSIEEQIDVFSQTKGLYNQIDNSFYTPSETTTGSDYYLLNKVLVYETVLDEGTTTSFDVAGNLLIDTNAQFTLDVNVGDIVAVEVGGVQYLKVLSVDSDSQLTLTGAFINASGIKYSIYEKGTKQNEAEKVSHSKITLLTNSLLTSPNVLFPSYTIEEDTLTVYPESVDSVGRVVSQYIRYPKEPRWTYIELQSGEPIFNQSQPDYQDFELSLEFENDLILKILQYAGVSIRESDIYQFGKAEETENNTKQ
jgi:hypothetical protein